MTAAAEIRPGEEWKRRPDAVREGMRWGVIIFFACLTFAVLAALAALVILFAISLAAHHPPVRL